MMKMSAQERYNMLYSLVQQYIAYKFYDKVWQRESSTSKTLAQGKLEGACMALELDIVETQSYIQLIDRDTQAIILEFVIDIENIKIIEKK